MSIVPPPGDTQVETLGHHHCPNCGKPAKSLVTRTTSTGTLNTDALCPFGHIWSVHWMGAA